MSDLRSSYAGNYPGLLKIDVILDEGAITVTDGGTIFDEKGYTSKTRAFATPLQEGDLVAISNDAAVLFPEAGGLIVVEKPVNTEAFVLGRIIVMADKATVPTNTTAADNLTKRLAGGFCRTAVIEVWAGITKIIAATVRADGTNSVAPGDTDTLKLDISDSIAAHDLCLVTAANGGTGLIAFHNFDGSGEATDLGTVLVGITGPLTAVS
jgi:hypothetical protein